MPPADRKDPYRNYNFLVEIDGVTVAGFAECSGVCIETTVVEYRNGNELNHVRKLPGLTKYSNIVLKRGFTSEARDLWDWYKTVLDGTTERRSGSIVLLNQARQESARWNFRDAWPCKYEGPVFNARGNETAIETFELAVEFIELV